MIDSVPNDPRPDSRGADYGARLAGEAQQEVTMLMSALGQQRKSEATPGMSAPG